jgi:hypothetical protein
MSKNNKTNREELLQQENQILKELIGLEAQLDQTEESSESEDVFAGLRKLTMPPKVDASFYVGHMPPPWSPRNRD